MCARSKSVDGASRRFGDAGGLRAQQPAGDEVIRLTRGGRKRSRGDAVRRERERYATWSRAAEWNGTVTVSQTVSQSAVRGMYSSAWTGYLPPTSRRHLPDLWSEVCEWETKEEDEEQEG